MFRKNVPSVFCPNFRCPGFSRTLSTKIVELERFGHVGTLFRNDVPKNVPSVFCSGFRYPGVFEDVEHENSGTGTIWARRNIVPERCSEKCAKRLLPRFTVHWV